jgi:hypothetical protein
MTKTKTLIPAAMFAFMAAVIIFSMLSSAALAQVNLKEEEQKAYDKQTIESNSLFDIFVSIPQDFSRVEPGGELLTSIKLINLGSSGRIDVVLSFEIKDSTGLLLLTKKETVAVETQANFVRTFVIPPEAKPGQYTIYVKMIYADGKEAVAESFFEVGKEPPAVPTEVYAIALLLVLITGVIFLISRLKPIINRLKLRQEIRRIVRRNLNSKTDAKTDAKTDSNIVTKTDANLDSRTGPKADTKTDTKSDSNTGPKTDSFYNTLDSKIDASAGSADTKSDPKI